MAVKSSQEKPAQTRPRNGTKSASRKESPVDLSKKAALIVDHGTFVELALRLAREGGFGTVYYCDPTWQTAFAIIDHAVIGDGFRKDRVTPIIRVKEPWDLVRKRKVDCVIYPDVHRAEEQEMIEEDFGIPVWGSRHASELETSKLRFKKVQDQLGLKHADYEVIHTLDGLRRFCQDPANNDRWIKISPQYRGNKETFHHINYDESREHLAEMDLQFGIKGEILKFLAEKPVKGKLEGGLDTYVIDGMHPLTVVSGWEKKDKGYFAEVITWDQIAQELRDTIEPIFPLFKRYRCRQMVSTEVVLEDRILHEPTIRFPSPAGEEQMELYANFPQIIWEGAHGRCIEPVLAKDPNSHKEARFACEAMVEHNGEDKDARSLEIPDEARQWVKLYNICKIGKKLDVAPGSNIIGAVVGIGDSPKAALEHLKHNAAGLKDQPVTVHLESIPYLIEEIEEAKSKGMAFQGAILPEPADALESATA